MRRPLIVTGGSPHRWSAVLAPVTSQAVSAVPFQVAGEPGIEDVRAATRLAASEQCDGIVAIGGGGVLDAAKATSVLLRNPGDVMDYLEVIGGGQPLQHPAAPCIALPTTAGTGAEVTRNAVLFSPEHRVKVSLRSQYLLPAIALVDPELTQTLPPEQTMASGMDALTQLIESFVSSRANPLTDGFCLRGLRGIGASLERAFASGNDLEAREAMSLSSLLSGLSLANAGLGVIHGFAGVLGGMFSAPHGAVCAALLPYGMAANIRHLRNATEAATQRPESLERHRIVAQLLTSDPAADAEDGAAYVHQLSERLKARPLGSFGIRPEAADEVVQKAEQASSMKANPVKLTQAELKQVYLEAL